MPTADCLQRSTCLPATDSIQNFVSVLIFRVWKSFDLFDEEVNFVLFILRGGYIEIESDQTEVGPQLLEEFIHLTWVVVQVLDVLIDLEALAYGIVGLPLAVSWVFAFASRTCFAQNQSCLSC